MARRRLAPPPATTAHSHDPLDPETCPNVAGTMPSMLAGRARERRSRRCRSRVPLVFSCDETPTVAVGFRRDSCRGRVGLLVLAATAKQRVNLGQTLLALALPAPVRQPVDAPARPLQNRLRPHTLQRAIVGRC